MGADKSGDAEPLDPRVKDNVKGSEGAKPTSDQVELSEAKWAEDAGKWRRHQPTKN